MFRRTAAPKNSNCPKRLRSRSECAAIDLRDGSTLLVVMVLLGMLSLVGFLFYTFAASERSNATYFADSHKIYTSDLDSDALFDWSLQQLIVGPSDNLTHSALAGRRHSMLPNLFGRDIHPYNSAGIKLMTGHDRVPLVDMNYNNTPDDVEGYGLGNSPIEFNDSAPANGGVAARDLTGWPDPGVDYTYPDINNLFLAYKGYAVDQYGNTVQVIIPSFHRPQLLRSMYGPDGAPGVRDIDDDMDTVIDNISERGLGDDGLPSPTWYQDAEFAGRVLRPHPSHLNPDQNPRFPTSTAGTTLTSTFPFGPDVTNPNRGSQGVWSRTNPTDTQSTYEWDVDNDGDLIKEGVWLDLQYPVQTDASGRKFVPLFSFTVYDADALFNLNVHGNHAYLSQLNRLGDFYQDDTLPTPLPINAAGNQRFLSGSNQGVTPSEVNPQYALNSDPNIGPDFSGTAADLSAALQQYAFEFGNAPTTRLTLSNMDWYRLLTGTANFQSATAFNDVYAGRYGEATSVMLPALQQGVANGGASATRPNQMPFPGVTGTDDNWNKYEGQFAWDFHSKMPGVTQPSPTLLSYSPGTPMFFPSQFNYYASYPYGQPLDFNGDGAIVGNGSLGKSRMTTAYNRVKYPQYRNYDNAGASSTYLAAYQLLGGTQGDTTNVNSVAAGWRPDSLLGQQMIDILGQPYFTGPNQGPVPSTQIDEPAETIVEPTKVSSSDNIFGLSENAALHLEATDRNNTSISSRVRQLASFNLQASNRADQIAKRFATSSWDRRQFGYAGTGGDKSYLSGLPLPPSPMTFNPTNLPAAATVTSPVNCYGDAVTRRPWEFSDILDRNGNPYFGQGPAVTYDGLRERFPPVIYSFYDTFASQTKQVYLNSADFNLPASARNSDPFRYPVRRILEITSGDTAPGDSYQFRLSLNHLTTTDSLGNIIQRPLTPHDPNLSKTPVGFGSGTQEDIARRDRQQMARDIYVMLYALGGGLDYPSQSGFTGPIGAAGYTGDNSGRNLYNDRQLREMAQFAVNVVDALDPDHVMTKFEYDKNLGNGWNLNDNPYDNDGFTPYGSSTPNYNSDYPEDSDERGVVYGVEAQGLTISEVLAFQCPAIGADHAATLHDDSRVRYFTFIELRNIGLDTIDFQSGQWRLRAVPGVATPIQRAVTIRRGTINPGQLFVIGNAGETDAAAPALNKADDLASPPPPPQDKDHSRFRCDNSNFGMGAYDPTSAAARIAPPTQLLDLDLLNDRYGATPKFRLVDLNNTLTDVSDDADLTSSRPGGFLNETTIVAPTNAVTFILERRQYPYRPEPGFQNQSEEDDNPWVPVDSFQLANLPVFGLQLTDSSRATYDMRLQALVSQERAQPMDRAGVAAHAGAIQANSLTNENTNSLPTFPTWQLTYDRPFASPVELLHVPVFGPNNVTRWLPQINQPPLVQTENMQTLAAPLSSTPGAYNEIPLAASAAGKILQPEDYNNLQSAPGSKTPALDNRWYRLFEFFEVPTRMHRQLGNPLSQIRQPGKLNLNTLRHTDVLAGLLDDTDVMTFAGMQTTRPTLEANDPADNDPNMPTGRRDWWVQFLQARDGRRVFMGDQDTNGNPIPRNLPDNVTGLYLPGLADSSPFRSLSTAAFIRNSGSNESPQYLIDQTIFRRLPADVNAPFVPPSTPPYPVTDKRHLWEVGNATEHQGGAVDSELRHRLLSKIFNNTTTRSHVFLVFVSVQPFEADDSAGAQNVRIGGVLRDTNGNPQFNYRGFFVIDRSQPEEAYVFDPSTGTGNFSNWQALVKYRLRLN